MTCARDASKAKAIRKSLASAIVLVAALAISGQVRAQGGPTTLQFSFSNPGARSLGLGGAFVALADDATAAFANPAGLTQLTRPEVSLEGRRWDYATPFAVGGRVSGEPTGIGLDGPVRVAESKFDSSALSFLSLVYPRDKWTLALSHHRLAEFETSSFTQGLFTDDTIDDPQPVCLDGTNLCRYRDVRRRTRISVKATALSFAYRVLDNLSLGAGLSYFQSTLGTSGIFYDIVDETLPQGFFGPNAYAPEAVLGLEDLDFDDTDLKVNFGLLWLMAPQWSLGAVYRPGGEFGGRGSTVTGPSLDPPIPEGTVGIADPAMQIKIPDVYGMGLAYRSRGGAWTGSFEWDLVKYSQILESLGRSPLVETGFVALDDVIELRLGLEYAFLRWSPLVAVRGGAWRNPDHTIRTIEDDPLDRVLLPGGADEVHLSLGAGIVFKNLQIDLAADFSDLVDTAALSLIYQF